MREQLNHIMKNYERKSLKESYQSAVLLPIIKNELGEWCLLFEKRSAFISQPGDSSFPGGRIEEGEHPSQGALRECMEELNIKKENIDLLGEMDYILDRNTIIYSFVAVIQGITFSDIKPNSKEVEEVYALPLSYLWDTEPKRYSMKLSQRLPNDFPRQRLSYLDDFEAEREEELLVYSLEDYFLWGYTASLTHRFIELLKESEAFNEKQVLS